VSESDEFAAMYSRYYQRIFAYSVRRVGLTDADEITSQVFLQAWRHWQDDSAARGLAWLYKTAQFTILNYNRGQRRRRALQHDLEQTADDVGLDTVDLVEDKAKAAAALSSLSQSEREILLLSAWDGLSNRQLSQVLDCSEAASYVRLHRARRKLQQAFDDYGTKSNLSLKECWNAD